MSDKWKSRKLIIAVLGVAVQVVMIEVFGMDADDALKVAAPFIAYVGGQSIVDALTAYTVKK